MFNKTVAWLEDMWDLLFGPSPWTYINYTPDPKNSKWLVSTQCNSCASVWVKGIDVRPTPGIDCCPECGSRSLGSCVARYQDDTIEVR
jgi:hypothetical protein